MEQTQHFSAFGIGLLQSGNFRNLFSSKTVVRQKKKKKFMCRIRFYCVASYTKVPDFYVVNL